jgi:hypothetical protein
MAANTYPNLSLVLKLETQIRQYLSPAISSDTVHDEDIILGQVIGHLKIKKTNV